MVYGTASGCNDCRWVEGKGCAGEGGVCSLKAYNCLHFCYASLHCSCFFCCCCNCSFCCCCYSIFFFAFTVVVASEAHSVNYSTQLSMKLAGKAHVFNQRSGGVFKVYKEYRVYDYKGDMV